MFSKTRVNFWVDATLFTLFIATSLTGLALWLILPGGRGHSELPLLGLAHYALRELHRWVGMTTLLISTLHLALHWRWLTCMIERFGGKTSTQARLNFGLDSLLFITFLLTSLSGLSIWLLLSGGDYRGGRAAPLSVALFGFTRPDWTALHRWAGLLLILIVALHLTLHWRWIVCTLRNYTRVSRRKLISASP
jgi:hypothetical protein